jgi:[ribosomal protein S5]-alanine N-acetyltransferase
MGQTAFESRRLGFQELCTRRLLLRPLTIEDSKVLFPLMADPRTIGGLGHAHQSFEETFHHVSELCQAPEGHRVWIIRRHSTVIGAVGVFDVEDGIGEIAYFIAASKQRQGFGGEAVARVVYYAFQSWGLHRLWAKTLLFNVSSRRILEKLGFRQEGRLRQSHYDQGSYHDILVYGLLAVEYAPLQPPQLAGGCQVTQ